MAINKSELKKISYEFNRISNRLMKADVHDYSNILGKFLAFIETTITISDYVNDCGDARYDVESEIKEVSGYSNLILDLGEDESEEVANIYHTLKYCYENKVNISHGLAFSYSNSKKYQDKLNGFNQRVTLVLISHISAYLTRIGIEMGLDENTKYTINVHNGQMNLATDNSTIHAVQNNGMNGSELEELIRKLISVSSNLSESDSEIMNDSLETITHELSSENPKKGMVRTAISGLQGIKSTAEFAAASIAIVQFVQTLL